MADLLTANTLLMCAPDLELHIKQNSRVDLHRNGVSISGGAHTLAILYAFRQSIALKDALARLNPLMVSGSDWVELMDTILMLHKTGVLIEPTQTQPSVTGRSGGAFDASQVHIRMLNDRQRTETYLKAIRETVRPGDVVVDLGTGSGVLAIAAAQAGASRVYAIEATSIGEVARMNFEANHIEDRIILVRGRSIQVTLPERADVLVSEIIGNEPLQENIIEFTRDAVKRFLKPEARLIPFRMSIYAQLVTLPDEKRKEFFFDSEMLENWKTWYNIDFSRMKGVTTKRPFAIRVKPYEPRDWQSLSEPVLVQALDLKTMTSELLDIEVTITVQSVGRLDGILFYPVADLTPKIALTRAPALVDENNSWRSPIWVLPEAVDAQPGDQYRVTYQYGTSKKGANVSVTRL